eukprot:CAMPEP_0201524346 /NCGR_PEP_ID=MMETSP0161_2-20130828/21267_1 /ASSEMBLY_ACC=CAM_ASM_000251 /TAXON_ID=180227 /ORGANISM="Neoparamoeba aestuarina, Strain SoJaBio B1-5/56/2" /LENGTH=238 /DNA_ID=CAMNT_0047923679 /DNA_START=24 /DNA_END=740 /DNA_ORIENTATION=+
MHFLLLCFVDPSLGKVDKASLPQQTLMELLIENITNKEDIYGQHGNPTDMSTWHNVTCNANGDVTEIDWPTLQLCGDAPLEWLPLTVINVTMWSNELTGTIALDALPDGLQYLRLSVNRLSGEVDLTHLPPGMRYLTISVNKLVGTVNLEHLPRTLEKLFLNDNLFHGTVNLTKLPPNLDILTISYNAFEGETDFSLLPKSLNYLAVSSTKLSGVIYAKKGKVGAENSSVEVRPPEEK